MKVIKILGAGPSGLSAAITLAKSGYCVDVFEKNDAVGKRFLGDLQGLENWTDKQDVLDHFSSMNISVNFDCDPFDAFNICDGDAINETIMSRRPIFYLVKRGGHVPGSLDNGLRRQALDAGVSIHFKETISDGDADIIATGPRSKEVCCIDTGIIFDTDMDDIAIALVDDNVAPLGYAYLLVTKGYGCICTVIFEDFKNVRRYFDKARKALGGIVKLDIRNEKTVGGLGSICMGGQFSLGNTRFVGEAGGIQDMFWGFGIRTAVTSGFLAARSIIDGTDYSAVAEKAFSAHLKAGIVNRFLWEKIGKFKIPIMLNIMKKYDDPMLFFRSVYNYNTSQKIIYPVAKCWGKRHYPQVWC